MEARLSLLSEVGRSRSHGPVRKVLQDPFKLLKSLYLHAVLLSCKFRPLLTAIVLPCHPVPDVLIEGSVAVTIVRRLLGSVCGLLGCPFL